MTVLLNPRGTSSEPGAERSQSIPDRPASNHLQLVLALVTSGLFFALFATVPGMLPLLSKQMHLSEAQGSFFLSLLIFAGSVGRIPLGMLSDRFEDYKLLPILLVLSLLGPLLMPFLHTYHALFACVVFYGVPLAAYSVTVSFASSWYPTERQGIALGLLGLGQFGQSLALFGAPRLVKHFGYPWGYWTFALLTALWLPVLWLLIRRAPREKAPAKGWDFIQPLREPASWTFSLFYFFTFGCLLTMAAYLPKFLTQMFNLTPSDAGMRAAGFVVIATIGRPIGGYMADHMGARKILHWVFPLAAVLGGLMAISHILTFTVGAIGIGLVIGIGNGAVFKLVPQHFPRSVGAVTGVVGTFGVLGGSIPPIVLGLVHEKTHSYALGFIFLAAFALLCWGVIQRTCSRCYRLECDCPDHN